jgi:hypothetical protein
MAGLLSLFCIVLLTPNVRVSEVVLSFRNSASQVRKLALLDLLGSSMLVLLTAALNRSIPDVISTVLAKHPVAGWIAVGAFSWIIVSAYVGVVKAGLQSSEYIGRRQGEETPVESIVALRSRRQECIQAVWDAAFELVAKRQGPERRRRTVGYRQLVMDDLSEARTLIALTREYFESRSQGLRGMPIPYDVDTQLSRCDVAGTEEEDSDALLGLAALLIRHSYNAPLDTILDAADARFGGTLTETPKDLRTQRYR